MIAYQFIIALFRSNNTSIEKIPDNIDLSIRTLGGYKNAGDTLLISLLLPIDGKKSEHKHQSI